MGREIAGRGTGNRGHMIAKRLASIAVVSALWFVAPVASSNTAERPTDRKYLVPADVEECQDAISAYRSALSDVMDNLHLYSQCVAASRGKDDCSSEFSSLQSAHDDFETAVSNYGMDCD